MVSIIVTCYNIENTIGYCLESLLNQSYRDLDIILINDCSTDNSLSVVQSYIEKDSRIRVINNTTNLGPGISRNIGLSYAKGDYVMVIDGDDIITPQFIEKLHDLAVTNNADIVNGKMLLHDYKPSFDKQYVSIEEKVDYIKTEECTFINNKLIKRHLFDKVQYCNKRYAEDIIPYYKLIYYANKIVCDINSQEYYEYVMRDTSLTHDRDIPKLRLLMSLSHIDLAYFLLSLNDKDIWMKAFNKFQLKNNVGDFLNPKKVNQEEYKSRYPKEYQELVTKWAELKPLL